jgi:Cys-rich four helix bundle protein (predicted Tat secretion target)
MKRRDFVRSSGAAIAAAASMDFLLGREAQAADSSGLAVSAEKCVGTGEACLDHCISMMSTGDTSMAACAKSVREMLLVCRPLAQAARQGSKRTAAIAKLALDACNECMEECRKHSAAPCKACLSACEDCAKHCKSASA